MTTAASEKYCLTSVKIVHQNFNKCNGVKTFQENLFSLFFLHTKSCSEKNLKNSRPLNVWEMLQWKSWINFMQEVKFTDILQGTSLLCKNKAWRKWFFRHNFSPFLIHWWLWNSDLVLALSYRGGDWFPWFLLGVHHSHRLNFSEW